MSFKILKISCDPAQPHTGQPFRLTVELDRKVESEELVSLEKQRIVKSLGGFPELRPTGPDYFSIDPKPIKIDAGRNKGTSDPIKVKACPIAQSGEPTVMFPEQLLFTAFGKPDGLTCQVVAILSQDFEAAGAA